MTEVKILNFSTHIAEIGIDEAYHDIEKNVIIVKYDTKKFALLDLKRSAWIWKDVQISKNLLTSVVGGIDNLSSQILNRWTSFHNHETDNTVLISWSRFKLNFSVIENGAAALKITWHQEELLSVLGKSCVFLDEVPVGTEFIPIHCTNEEVWLAAVTPSLCSISCWNWTQRSCHLVKQYCCHGNLLGIQKIYSGDCVLLLETVECLISIVSLATGNELTQAKYRKFLTDDEIINLATVDDQLNSLCLLTNKQTLYKLPLVSQYPQHNKPSLGNHNYMSRNVYDKTWRKELMSLDKQHNVGTIHQTLDSSQKRVSTFKTKPSPGDQRSSVLFADLSCEIKDWLETSIATSNGTTCIVGVMDTVNGKSNIVLHVDETTKELSKISVDVGCQVLLSRSCKFPHLVLTKSYIAALAFVDHQEQLINRLMVYDSAAVADTLCCVNDWDRCSIPIHALEVGLKHRQLDTVAFFLKSRETAFSQIIEPTSVTSMEQCEAVFKLLSNSIHKLILDQQTKNFACQLLHLTLTHLHKVLQSLLLQSSFNETIPSFLKDLNKDSSSYSDTEVSQLVVRISSFILNLRSLISSQDIGLSKQQTNAIHDKVELNSMKTVTKWDGLSVQEVTEDGLLNGSLASVQAFLYEMYGAKVGNLESIISIGLQTVVVHLKQRNLDKALKLLTNMGFDITAKLKEMCMKTSDRSLREYLISVLMGRDAFTPDEEIMICNLHNIETLYTCQSFKQVLEQINLTSGSDFCVDPLRLDVPSDRQQVIIPCGDIHREDVTDSCESSTYSHFVLSWLQGIDEKTIQLILLEKLISVKDLPMRKRINAEVIWIFFIKHNMVTELTAWIEIQFPLKTDNNKGDDIEWPYHHFITHDMINNFGTCTSYLRNIVLHELARRGIFCNEDIVDFEKLLFRISTVYNVYDMSLYSNLAHDYSNLDLDHFYECLVKSLVDKGLAVVLYHVTDEFRELRSLCESQHDTAPWIDMLLKFQDLSLDPNGESLCEASLAAAKYVYRKSTINDMLREGHVLSALATLLYCKRPLHELLAGESDDVIGQLDLDILSNAIQPYPKLQSALFPSASCTCHEQDITVYELLMGNAPFDPSRLFSWQMYNTMASEGLMKEMPHFSHPVMQAKYGYSESLQASYYLLHGRPSFAFLTFLISQLEAGASTISPMKVNEACKKAKYLAISNFNKPMVAGACVAFMEMLGRDSTLVRNYLNAASVTYNYALSLLTGPVDRRREMEKIEEQKIVDSIVACIKHKRNYAMWVMEYFERATCWSIDKDNLKCDSMETALRWHPVLLFSQLHNLPLSTVHLERCAKDDNWLCFMLFAQIHQYSKEEVEGVLHHFTSRQLQEHLTYVIQNVVASSEILSVQKSQHKYRDIRASLYSRVGVNRKKDRSGSIGGVVSSSSEEDTTASSAVEVSSETNIPKDISVESIEDNLFSVLFNCQASPSPWRSLLSHCVALRNPILAVLAACIKDHDTISCLCCWLIVSALDGSQSDLMGYFVDMEHRNWIATDADLIVNLLIKTQQVKTINNGFNIFTQDSAMCCLFGFMHNCDLRQWQEAGKNLETFRNRIEKLRKNKSQQATSEVESSTLMYLQTYLIQVPSICDMMKIVECIHSSGFIRCLKTDNVPPFHKLANMYKIANKCDCVLDAAKVIYPDNIFTFNEHCEEVIAEMIKTKHYDCAYMFAEICGFSNNKITTQELYEKLQEISTSLVWVSDQARIMFWRQCDQTLKEKSVDFEHGAEFFLENVPDTENNENHENEAIIVLELALNWSRNVTNFSEEFNIIDDIEQRIWKLKLSAEEKLIIGGGRRESFSDLLLMFDKRETEQREKVDNMELLQFGRMPRKDDSSSNQYTETEKVALDSLLGKMLNNGNISEASRLAAELKHYSQDLAIILTCIRLAQGSIAPNDIDSSMKQLLANELPPEARRHRRLSMSISQPTAIMRSVSTMTLNTINDVPTGSAISASEYLEQEVQEVVYILEQLSQYCIQGQTIACRVLTAYKVAQMLKQSYDFIIKEKEFSVLEALLAKRNTDTFTLARSYIWGSGVSDNEISSYVADVLLQSLSAMTRCNVPCLSNLSSSTDLVFNLADDPQAFTELIRLCKDPSLLGNRLLDAASSLTSHVDSEVDPGCLSMEVELLIHAHDCHTLACNMAGIARVLREARHCTDHLAAREEYTLVIRLLTGVGRFSEMTYVFDLLKQSHQFELLFRKGIEKENKLRLAVLDYLKRNDPTDSDTYTMVSLHFTMYREIAQMLEETAIQHLDSLQNKTLDNSSEVQQMLQNIQQYFCDAAESYVKEDCLRHAQRCLQQARLVALQINLLSSGQRLLHMDDIRLSTFIASHTKFWESYIVAEAYGKNPEWSGALYHNTVQGGDVNFFHDVKAHICLDPSIFTQVTERYKRETCKSSQLQANMKKLLSYCPDVLLQYQLASSLGFTDVTQDMMKSEHRPYLRDSLELRS